MTPPVIPSWLLRTFGSGPSVNALLGDLAEEYQDGRSATWFWGQSLMGVAVTFFSELRSHWLFALRAVLVGFVTLRLLGFVGNPARASLDDWLQAHVATVTYMQWQLYGFTRAGVWFGVAVVAGWIVGQLHAKHREVAVLVAAAVVQERADWGMTLDTIARSVGLGFIPVQHEQYDFVVPNARTERSGVKTFRERLADPATRAALAHLGMKP